MHLENNEFSLKPGQSLDIPLETNHALGNKTNEPVVLIEVQMGSYFGEDDIVRVNDPYDQVTSFQLYYLFEKFANNIAVERVRMPKDTSYWRKRDGWKKYPKSSRVWNYDFHNS